MTTNKLNFTKASLLKAPTPPKGKLDYYKDTRENGLELIATSGGSKTFYLYRKINGKPERVKLGKFPDMSVENARKAAQRNKGLIADGINPNEEKRRIRDEHTFKELFNEYMERYSKVHKKSWQYDEREVNKHLSHLFKRKISTITKDEVSRLHAKIGKDSGIYQANRILERTRSIFNKAIEWGWRGINPATGIKKFKEQARDRFLSAEEIPQFFKALEQEENKTARDFFKVLLLTGVRKSNSLTMRWEDISFKERTWRIPETKNGDPLTVPLNENVIDLLKDRLKDSDSEWVFPGDGKSGHLNDPKKAWGRLLNRANLKDLRMHDLRRTFGSWQAALGANSYVIGKSLGHKSQQATAIYARLNLDPVRESTDRAIEAMLLKANPSPSNTKDTA
ncbi:MAG: tyrosine-type recombinase/integrase [Alphaproteobacteria bacterium]